MNGSGRAVTSGETVDVSPALPPVVTYLEEHCPVIVCEMLDLCVMIDTEPV
jgi:hypothetical protein